MTYKKINDNELEEEFTAKRIFLKDELLLERKELENRIKEIDNILKIFLEWTSKNSVNFNINIHLCTFIAD